MSSLYNWHDEQMVRLEMQDLYREMEQIRLLNDAGQKTPSWIKLQLARIEDGMRAIGLPLRRRFSTHAPQYYQSTSFKFSP